LWSYCYNCPSSYIDINGNIALNYYTIFLLGLNSALVIIMKLFPHHLPNLAPPGTILRQREKQGGKLRRKRYYGDDGRPVKDREYTNHGDKDIPNPHDNPFGETANGGWGHNGEHNPVEHDDPDEGIDYDPEKGWGIAENVIGATLLIGGVVGAIYIIANDVTIVGVADDIPGLVAAGESIWQGLQMLFG